MSDSEYDSDLGLFVKKSYVAEIKGMKFTDIYDAFLDTRYNRNGTIDKVLLRVSGDWHGYQKEYKHRLKLLDSITRPKCDFEVDVFTGKGWIDSVDVEDSGVFEMAIDVTDFFKDPKESLFPPRSFPP